MFIFVLGSWTCEREIQSQRETIRNDCITGGPMGGCMLILTPRWEVLSCERGWKVWGEAGRERECVVYWYSIQ